VQIESVVESRLADIVLPISC